MPLERAYLRAGHGPFPGCDVQGHHRACEDDVGASLKSIHVLNLVFAAARKATPLELNTKKRILVPTASPWSINLARERRTWLQGNLAEWSECKIAPVAKYLGFFFGPGVVVHSWSSA